MTFASFQGFGKWYSRRLNKWVKCINGRLGMCLRVSLGMPSIPLAFLHFEAFYTLDPWLLNTIFVAPDSVLPNDLDKKDRCLCPNV